MGQRGWITVPTTEALYYAKLPVYCCDCDLEMDPSPEGENMLIMVDRQRKKREKNSRRSLNMSFTTPLRMQFLLTPARPEWWKINNIKIIKKKQPVSVNIPRFCDGTKPRNTKMSTTRSAEQL